MLRSAMIPFSSLRPGMLALGAGSQTNGLARCGHAAHGVLAIALAWCSAGCLSLSDDNTNTASDTPVPNPNPVTTEPPSTTEPPATPPTDAGPTTPAPPDPPSDNAPRIVSFTATPAVVPFLGTTSLSWSSENADSCRISPDVGAVPTAGSATVSAGAPGSQRIFVLQCERNGIHARAEVTIETRSIVYTGTLVVRTAADLASLTNVNVVTGDVVIENASGFFNLAALSSLVEVQGALLIRTSPSIANISLPNLTRVGDDLALDDLVSLALLSMPSLEHIGDRLYVSRTPELNPVSVRALVEQVEARDGIGGAILTFPNQPATILSSLQQGFDCIASDSADPYYLLLYDAQAGGGSLYLENSLDTSIAVQGTYVVQGDSIVLQIPNITNETTSPLEFEYDHVIAFSSPSFSLCHAIESGLDDGLSQEQELECPIVQYSLGSGSEQNRFWLRPHGQVEWHQTIQLVQQGNQPQTFVRRGIYVFNGIWIHLAFGNNLNGDRFMTGTLSFDNTRLLLDELSPELGPCTPPG